MPYIKEREYWDNKMKELKTAVNSETDAGDMNYIVTNLMIAWVKDKMRYIKICLVVGTLICVLLEFYRRIVAPYENKKIKENGDVYPKGE